MWFVYKTIEISYRCIDMSSRPVLCRLHLEECFEKQVVWRHSRSGSATSRPASP